MKGSVGRISFLLAVFFLSLVFWAAWYLPASVLVSRLPSIAAPSGQTLVLSNAQGRVWQGQAEWHWASYEGRLSWRLDWHGTTPGIAFDATGSGLKASGWLATLSEQIYLKNAVMSVPLPLALAGQRQIEATGVVSGRIKKLVIQGGAFDALKGRLHYTGGNGRWRQQTAMLPVMNAQLGMQNGQAQALLTDQHGTKLALALVNQKQHGKVTVYRALAKALGFSRGQGKPTDVIFTLGQSLKGMLP